MDFENGAKNIQTADFNSVHTVYKNRHEIRKILMTSQLTRFW